MANARNPEPRSFRRAFTLVILLVVVPAALVSGFGVVAIVNERAAVEKKLEQAWAARIEVTTRSLEEALRRAQVTTVDPFVVTVGETPLTGPGFSIREGAVDAPAELRQLLGAVHEGVQITDRPVLMTLGGPGELTVVAMARVGDVIRGCVVPLAQLEAVVSAVGASELLGESAHWQVLPVKRVAGGSMMERVASGVAEARESALGPRELSSRMLPVPLQDLRLAAISDGDDPVARASFRNRLIYVVLLFLFYVALSLGVVFTGRLLAREERLSTMKTDFVSLVSHELRTPLTSIRMFIEMLATNRVNNEQEKQEVLNLLAKETTRLSGMIEGVLDWARIESGKKQYALQLGEAKLIVDTAVEAFRAQRMGAEMNFTVEAQPTEMLVNADAESISGSLLNLLQNAFKYSGADKRIALRVYARKNEVVMEVEDNGPGIARREQRRIFERFYRVDDLLTRKTEGSGLGLSIAHRIVKAHGGRITVDSTVGKGSTFRIHLPKVSHG